MPLYNRESLQPFVRGDEKVFHQSQLNKHDMRRVFDYEYFLIGKNSDEDSNAMLVVVPHQGNVAEPVEIVGEVDLEVRAVNGCGLLLVKPKHSEEVTTYVLDGSEAYDEIAETVFLSQGDSYAYYNAGREPFIVRDDATPACMPEDERQATDPLLLRALAQLGIKYYDQVV